MPSAQAKLSALKDSGGDTPSSSQRPSGGPGGVGVEPVAAAAAAGADGAAAVAAAAGGGSLDASTAKLIHTLSVHSLRAQETTSSEEDEQDEEEAELTPEAEQDEAEAGAEAGADLEAAGVRAAAGERGTGRALPCTGTSRHRLDRHRARMPIHTAQPTPAMPGHVHGRVPSPRWRLTPVRRVRRAYLIPPAERSALLYSTDAASAAQVVYEDFDVHSKVTGRDNRQRRQAVPCGSWHSLAPSPSPHRHRHQPRQQPRPSPLSPSFSPHRRRRHP